MAGGVNLVLSPGITINFSRAGVMAPDGRCKTFDSRADGYVRGEGAGLVVLKPLARALADGDRIYAVIRGSAVNQDGRTNGLLAPNRQAQEAVLREAYAESGVAPGKVQYIEAHGTGTFLGDSIEANALGTVLAEGRSAGRPCVLGSVKTNIGHLEAAAGIAGLIKTALALRHREIPPSLHFEEPNPHIDFERLRLEVQRRRAPWPEHSGLALAGVSSFGFGGTNSHVVLEEAPAVPAAETRGEADGAVHLLTLSAQRPEALEARARAVLERLPGWRAGGVAVGDLCYSANVRRSPLDHRLAAVAGSSDELAAQLEAFLAGGSRPGLARSGRPAIAPPKVVFVFSGQGSQWPGMSRELHAREPVFREELRACLRAMESHVGGSLLEDLTGDEPRGLETIDRIQPALFAVQVALAGLWRSWGVEPVGVIGHSLGEVAAAHVAGRSLSRTPRG